MGISVRAGIWLLAVVAFAAAPAAARCGCLCVNGSYTAICTAPEEVGGNRGICHARAGRGCPSEPPAEAPAAYAAPVEGVRNCRSAQVYDAAADAYVTARVCDVGRPAADDG